MTKKYTAIRENVIVKVFCGEIKTASGIIIETSKRDFDMSRDECVVMDIGPFAFYDTDGCDVKVGDKIAIAKYAGKVLETHKNGDQIRVLKDIDLLCKIEELEQPIEEVK